MTKEMALVDFNAEQLALIKSQIAKDCNTNELQLFLYQCKQTGLNPLTRQIYAIRRSGKMTIQTSIDGFRVIAERSGSYAGQDEPVWEEDEKGFPIKCTVKVYRFTPNFEQRYCAGVGVAHFKEYYPNPILLQKTMPHTMIAKVAEALALRKAFPQDLSGLYTSDEMNQADKVKTEEVKIVNEDKPKDGFFKEPTGALAGLSEQAGNDNKESAEIQRLAKLKETLAGFGSVAEIDSYLESKYNNKTRLQILKEMSPINAGEAEIIIRNAKFAVDPE